MKWYEKRSTFLAIGYLLNAIAEFWNVEPISKLASFLVGM